MNKRLFIRFLFIQNLFMLVACGVLGPPKILVSEIAISHSDGFVNPITISRLIVDSLGTEHRPVKYCIDQFVTCSILQNEGTPPAPLKVISLVNSGRYLWSREEVDIPVIQNDGYASKLISSKRQLLFSVTKDKYRVCPVTFTKNTWYSIHFHDPQVAAIYIFVDDNRTINMYPTYTGVSPI